MASAAVKSASGDRVRRRRSGGGRRFGEVPHDLAGGFGAAEFSGSAVMICCTAEAGDLAGRARVQAGCFSAAARYFSISSGGSDSTSPMLSKP